MLYGVSFHVWLEIAPMDKMETIHHLEIGSSM